MRRASAVVLLACAGAFAGCLGDEPVAPEAGPAWLPGDRWTYRLDLRGSLLTDEWEVVGPAEVRGRPVVEVASTTTGPRGVSREVGAFDAETLALVRVVAEDATVDYDPTDVRLLPAADRTSTSTRTESRAGGTTTTRVDHDVRHAGVESVETGAGVFAAHRFEVRETRHGEDGPSTASSTYWWAPAALNVVRHEGPDGTVYRTLVSYTLADGPRTLPDV